MVALKDTEPRHITLERAARAHDALASDANTRDTPERQLVAHVLRYAGHHAEHQYAVEAKTLLHYAARETLKEEGWLEYLPSDNGKVLLQTEPPTLDLWDNSALTLSARVLRNVRRAPHHHCYDAACEYFAQAQTGAIA